MRCVLLGGRYKTTLLSPKAYAPDRGWMRGQATVSALETGNWDTEGSTIFPNLTWGVRRKFKCRRVPGPQPHRSSFWCDEWGETPVHVPCQRAVSGPGRLDPALCLASWRSTGESWCGLAGRQWALGGGYVTGDKQRSFPLFAHKRFQGDFEVVCEILSSFGKLLSGSLVSASGDSRSEITCLVVNLMRQILCGCKSAPFPWSHLELRWPTACAPSSRPKAIRSRTNSGVIASHRRKL